MVTTLSIRQSSIAESRFPVCNFGRNVMIRIHPVIVVMGVMGSGKSTISSLLAEEIDGVYLDADDYHPENNKKKISLGIPLSDEDRIPWLKNLSKILKEKSRNTPVVLACSALKDSYREILSEGLASFMFVYLKGDKQLLEERLSKRQGHFANPKLLESQLKTLEEPSPNDALWISIREEPSTLVETIVSRACLKKLLI